MLALLKQPFLAVAHKYNAVAQQRPMATGLITTVVKTSAADLFAQTVRAAAAARCCRLRVLLCSLSVCHAKLLRKLI